MSKQLSSLSTISKWFGGSPQNIHKTYFIKKPTSFKVLSIGSYILESGLSDVEIQLIVEAQIKIKESDEC